MKSFIDHDIINEALAAGQADDATLRAILAKAEKGESLSQTEVAQLLLVEDAGHIAEMNRIAGEIKDRIYGRRVVMFAPLYVSDYCVNNCSYCGYSHKNQFNRRRLSMDEIKREVQILESMGHKRLALEAGEDPVNCDIDYITDAMEAIYSVQEGNGSIRRINVNIAATTVENYKKLESKGIGTYILFQETYDEAAYLEHHHGGPKRNYLYHLTAFDRAMEAGIEDVGGGVLFGLADYRSEVLALLQHNAHLEEAYGVGFHTVSVPRLKKALGMDLSQYPHIVTDEQFKRIVTVLRLALPYVGIILSTRETPEIRDELLRCGISQLSAGSVTGVGGYEERENGEDISQFSVDDERSPIEIIKSLVDSGYIPSYCTACYRSGRTGDRFMQLAKSGKIGYVCEPNALMTLLEYIQDYGDDELKAKGYKFIDEHAKTIDNPKVREMTLARIERLKNGERDLYV